ncbi:MAG TPA: alpha/beta hydrolase [Pyrinomonadaceae bacterium]|nr:alpha/beta hydrolase [Pyrinomonadaceae bacterium]
MRTPMFITIALLITLQSASAVRQNGSKVILNDCEIRGVTKAKCGTYEVYENRATKKGRKISLKIVLIPATGDKREPEPLVYFAGGPGGSATEDASGIAQAFPKILAHRDLLFVDQRGTGGSHPLDCKFYDASDLQTYLGYFFPLDDVRKCREQLETNSDLKLYITTIAADDMDEVRAALGYERLNLFGGSYGTRAAMTYLKRHPQHVRAAILQGISPTDHFMPSDFPQQTERALQGVLSECLADKVCSEAFPNIKEETKSVLAQLIKGPVEVEIQKPNSNDRVKLKLSRDLAAEAIRYMLYSPVPASRVPLILHLASQGNYAPLARTAIQYRMNLVGSGSNGMYLSVTCAEDLPWIKPGEGERMAENTFLGDYRLRQQREACTLWPRAETERDYAQPVKSDVPVLILTGQWDPVTPPSNAERAAKTLTNSLNIVVPSGAHGLDGLEGMDCIDNLIVEFIERGTSKGLDTSCVKDIHRKGFALKFQ